MVVRTWASLWSSAMEVRCCMIVTEGSDNSIIAGPVYIPRSIQPTRVNLGVRKTAGWRSDRSSDSNAPRPNFVRHLFSLWGNVKFEQKPRPWQYLYPVRNHVMLFISSLIYISTITAKNISSYFSRDCGNLEAYFSILTVPELSSEFGNALFRRFHTTKKNAALNWGIRCLGWIECGNTITNGFSIYFGFILLYLVDGLQVSISPSQLSQSGLLPSYNFC